MGKLVRARGFGPDLTEILLKFGLDLADIWLTTGRGKQASTRKSKRRDVTTQVKVVRNYHKNPVANDKTKT